METLPQGNATEKFVSHMTKVSTTWDRFKSADKWNQRLIGHNGSPEWTARKAKCSILAFYLPWQQIKIRNLHTFFCLVDDYSTTFLKKCCQNTCNETIISAHFHFSHYKSVETLRYHRNKSNYATAIKTWRLMDLYRSIECIRYAELEQALKYMTLCYISFHPCRSIRKQIWPCHKNVQGKT